MKDPKVKPALFILTCGLMAFSLCAVCLFAQEPGTDRRFPNTKTDVDSDIQALQSSFSGRLPTLEGFVERPSEPIERFERGYYECSAKVSPDTNGQTLVRITAKITAWYADPSGAQSGYRVLASNGRIETDLLDQLGALLGRKSPTEPAPVRTLRPSPLLMGQPSLGLAPGPSSNAAVAPTSASIDEDLRELRQKREEAEKRAKSLEGQVQDLEEILRNEAHPDNLGVVRKSGTPVLSQPGGTALLTAEANDEFEILGMTRDWVHVQISGASRGWIRRTQLDLPEGFAQTAKVEGGSDVPDAKFRVSREETHPFTGIWPQLKGKVVNIVWIEQASNPGSKPASADAKRKFAESALTRAYQERASSSEPADGIVIVFDSADGGQVAATMPTLAQWTAGAMSDDAFWKQCLVDPPDFLQNEEPPKPTESAQPAPARGRS